MKLIILPDQLLTSFISAGKEVSMSPAPHHLQIMVEMWILPFFFLSMIYQQLEKYQETLAMAQSLSVRGASCTDVNMCMMSTLMVGLYVIQDCYDRMQRDGGMQQQFRREIKYLNPMVFDGRSFGGCLTGTKHICLLSTPCIACLKA